MPNANRTKVHVISQTHLKSCAMGQPWTPEQAWNWLRSRPFLFGCNFLPSTAVNSTDMWQAETFDAETISRELQLARGIGYNTVRVFIPFIVWDAAPQAFRERMEFFLAMADRCGISTMPILFDDCAFAGKAPYLGKQEDPVPGVHNSQWTPSPGFVPADDVSAWPRIEEYVKDIISAFGDDERVLIWDLYNEAGNSGRFEKSIPLLEAAFRWAREVGPKQPLTAGTYNWDVSMKGVNACGEALSDVVSFHCYTDLRATGDLIASFACYGRPLLCTEWLNRPAGSRFQTHLELFKRNNVGIYNWGLVVGKTQTHLNWDTMAGAPNSNPKEWQHDVLRPGGEVYDHDEIRAVRDLVGQDLVMKPVEMSSAVMKDLEERGLIIRLRPGAHALDARAGETLGASVYESADRFGPHKLITVTVNREAFAGFGTHPDNEEFLLIGDPNTKPLFLAIALCAKAAFEEKVKTGCLSSSDLIVLRCRYNDPEVSFFVMRKDVPHGEAIIETALPPATFYVTESRDLPLDIQEMRKYRLKVDR